MTLSKGQPVWVTEWTLTHGIIATQIEDIIDPPSDTCPIKNTMIGVLSLPGLPIHGKSRLRELPWGGPSWNKRICYFYKPHWHTDRTEALIQAQKVLQSKRRSLQRSTTKLNEAEARLLGQLLDRSKDVRV